MKNNQNQNPFKGLYSYKEEDREIFKGREQRADELFRLVKLNISTVVFGKSGIGKTSLINAGLLPKLREAAYLPILIRLVYSDSASPLMEQIAQRITKELEKNNVFEIAKGRNEKTDSFREDETLWEYFHRVDHLDKSGTYWSPVLIFDQFEEIFTICKKDSVRDQLKEELYYLIEEQVPDSLQKRCLENSTISPYMLSQARFRIVLGLKENYLPHLNWFKHRIPSIDRAPYRVPALNGSQAREVISIYKNFRDIEIQNDILNQLSPGDIKPDETLPGEGIEVEPLFLSLLCHQMVKKGTKYLSGQKMNQILESFYDETLESIPDSDELAEFIETKLLTGEGLLHALILGTDPS